MELAEGLSMKVVRARRMLKVVVEVPLGKAP